MVVGAVRERLPRRRKSSTFAFRVADCEGYVTVGEYDDGRPGEVFMKVSKQGSTLAGIMDAFSISVSLGLQHGVPLATYVRKYTNMRFEPAGITDDPDLRIATSLVDYIFRRLAVDYLPLTSARTWASCPPRSGRSRPCPVWRKPPHPSRTSSRTPGSARCHARARRRGPDDGSDDVSVAGGHGVSAGGAEQRAALLPVRHGHAASRLLLPVHQLRDDERLFVVRNDTLSCTR